MGERIYFLKGIWKSINPEELIVYHASSLEDEIRFYLNENQYVVARDNKNGTCSVILEEEKQDPQNEKQNTEGILDYIKRNIKKKDFLKFLIVSLVISFFIATVSFVLAIAISLATDNILIVLLLMNSIYLLIDILLVVIREYKSTSQSLKSKHSAEHMMVNFLVQNRRLPQNMNEFKQSSRFSATCGSRKKIRVFIENFIQSIFSIIIAITIEYFAFQNLKNDLLSGIAFTVIYFIFFYGIGILIHKYHKLNFIITPIENMLNNVIQCFNTTKKVDNRDLQLAYYAAEEWLQIVYPEFYNEEDAENNIFSESNEN